MLGQERDRLLQETQDLTKKLEEESEELLEKTRCLDLLSAEKETIVSGKINLEQKLIEAEDELKVCSQELLNERKDISRLTEQLEESDKSKQDILKSLEQVRKCLVYVSGICKKIFWTGY